MDRGITLYHALNTRSSGALALLEEIGAPYALHVLDTKAGENRRPAYLAVNPMGKVPALLDGEAVVTEQVAIFLHLADRFPEAGLAPALGDPLRGPYLRWMAFYAGCFEPAVVDRAMNREPAPQGMNPYGTFDAVIEAVRGALAPGPWLLGERFSAADLLWGSSLGWTMGFGLVPKLPEFAAHAGRVAARPAVARARAKDAALAAAQAAAPAAAAHPATPSATPPPAAPPPLGG
jgi:glutathione S-transferase